jgi:formiminoglutamase/guanidinobutyrase
MRIPHTQPSKIQLNDRPLPPTDLRLRDLIRPDEGRPIQIGMLGVPSDAGVIQGGGRAGAVGGPDAIRGQLKRYGTAYNFERQVDLSALTIADFGDLIPNEASVEETHQRLTEAVAAIVQLGAIPLVLGGGHDLTFGGVRGLSDSTQGAIGGLAIDAHFDVRETVNGIITSGTPFRNILEKIETIQGEHFVEIGGNGLVNSKADFDFLLMKKARLFSLAETRQKGMVPVIQKGLQIAGHGSGKVFCSIDLDSVAQAFAPGVSAPSPEGFTPEEVSLAAYLAGLHPKVAYFDIMELNPSFDQDARTARLAAALILHFLTGVAQRKKMKEKVIGFAAPQ